MEKIFKQVLLYDFYGELLTSHQRAVYEEAVYHDMSLSEIAELQGISRQGVHDLIKRCDKILQDYENKLHLVERFTKAKGKIAEIVEITKDIEKDAANRYAEDNKTVIHKVDRIRELSLELMKEL